MDRARSQHWQEAWARAGLAHGRADPAKGKFFAVNAYPGPSGFFHVGHLRAYAYLDALARFRRMRGDEVLLPFGVHASGIPAVAFAQKVRDRQPVTVEALRDAGLTEAEMSRLEDPEAVARFFLADYRKALERLGVLFDPATLLTTIDDDYRAFVAWQMRALARAGSLGQATHYAAVCPVCGPVAVDPSETDLSSGGGAEVVKYVTVPFALDDGRILLAATLRPETVYGATNVWLAPSAPLITWHSGERTFLLSPEAGHRMVEQHGGHLGHTTATSELVGRMVAPPFSGRRVPILASPVVDPAIGTGVVMSVPAHAPADAAALAELPEAMRRTVGGSPPVLLSIPADAALSPSEAELLRGHGTPAEKALNAVGATGLSDRSRLDEATERLYRLEYVRGRMTVPELSGVLVREARERVARALEELGTSFPLREFSVPVICRNGHAVVIRRLPNQWFLRYGDPAWKAETRATIDRLTTYPDDYARELGGILDWFEDRPCARHGRWLGTAFPLDPEWTVEPIADSTFYMAYFVVRRFVSTGRLRTEQLTDPFFDYVFLGVGPGEPSVPRPLLDEVRAEFLYWYPLDVNCGGKEHKRVHFPVFLYTHARLLPPELRPKMIFVNGWITGPTGAKLSKKDIASKKGGRIPAIDLALDEWGADALRLFYVLAVSPGQDLEFDPALVEAAVGRLAEVERLVRESRGEGGGPPELDAWLLSRAHDAIARIRRAFDGVDLRVAAEVTFVEIPTVLRRYYARGGAAGSATDALGRAWVRLISPFAPHLAEELGGGPDGGFVATASFPDPAEFPRDLAAEARERFLDRVEDDLRSVLRPLSDRGEAVPPELIFYVAAPWKRTVEQWLREAFGRGETPTIRSILERTQHHPELAAARSEIARYVERFVAAVRTEADPPPELDEEVALRAAEGFFVRRLGVTSIEVVPEAQGADLDPKGRRDRARPGRPAFYFVRPGERDRLPPEGARRPR